MLGAGTKGITTQMRNADEKLLVIDHQREREREELPESKRPSSTDPSHGADPGPRRQSSLLSPKHSDDRGPNTKQSQVPDSEPAARQTADTRCLRLGSSRRRNRHKKRETNSHRVCFFIKSLTTTKYNVMNSICLASLVYFSPKSLQSSFATEGQVTGATESVNI